MKRLVMAALLTLALAGTAMGKDISVREYTEGKAIGDSLATAADVLGVLKIPKNIAAMFFGVLADSTVQYTVDVSLDGTEWATAFVDTCAAGTYDEHELGVPTGGAASARAAYAMLPGYFVRLTADNLDEATCFAEIIIREEE